MMMSGAHSETLPPKTHACKTSYLHQPLQPQLPEPSLFHHRLKLALVLRKSRPKHLDVSDSAAILVELEQRHGIKVVGMLNRLVMMIRPEPGAVALQPDPPYTLDTRR